MGVIWTQNYVVNTLIRYIGTSDGYDNIISLSKKYNTRPYRMAEKSALGEVLDLIVLKL